MISPQELYSDIELSTEVMTASKHKLIHMLFVKCLYHIDAAKVHITERNLKKKHVSIKKAIDIITYLRECLDMTNQHTIELSSMLDFTYECLGKNLLHATLKDNVEYLNQATIALNNIKSGWEEISL